MSITDTLSQISHTVMDMVQTRADINLSNLSATGLAKLGENAGIEQIPADWAETDAGSYAYIHNKPTIPSNTSELINDSDFTTNALLSDGLSTKADDSLVVHKANTETISGKKTFTAQPYFQAGGVFGGTAQAAGLVTRGICGISTPNSDGTYTKEDLYLNYDGDNSYSRKVYLGGTATTNIAVTQGMLDNAVASKVNSADLSTVATSGSYNDLSNKPTIITSYNNLTDKPTIPVITDTYSATSTNGMSGKAVASAISSKANLASPTFTGTPKAPTAAAGTNTTQIATTAFVQAALSAGGGASGATVVDSYVSGTSWWRLWSDGWCEQGGRLTSGTVPVMGSYLNRDITLLKGMSNANYNISFAWFGGANLANQIGVTTSAITASKFTTSMYSNNVYGTISSPVLIWQISGYVS